MTMVEFARNSWLNEFRADCPVPVIDPLASLSKSTMYLLTRTFLTLFSTCPFRSISTDSIGFSIESKNQLFVALKELTAPRERIGAGSLLRSTVISFLKVFGDVCIRDPVVSMLYREFMLLFSLSISAFRELTDGIEKFLNTPLSSNIWTFTDGSVVVATVFILVSMSTMFLLKVMTWSATLGNELWIAI